MTSSWKQHTLVYVLPFLHLCACAILIGTQVEEAGQYLLLIDFPASVLILLISSYTGHLFAVFVIFGTLWWYLVSRAAAIIFRAVGAIQSRKPSARS